MLQLWRLPAELPQSPRHPRHRLHNRRCLALSRERMSQRRKKVGPSESVTGCLALEPEDASGEVAPRRLRLLQETCSVPPPHRLTWEPVLSEQWSHRCSISQLCRSPYALLSHARCCVGATSHTGAKSDALSSSQAAGSGTIPLP